MCFSFDPARACAWAPFRFDKKSQPPDAPLPALTAASPVAAAALRGTSAGSMGTGGLSLVPVSPAGSALVSPVPGAPPRAALTAPAGDRPRGSYGVPVGATARGSKTPSGTLWFHILAS
jgi:hypothetical protein